MTTLAEPGLLESAPAGVRRHPRIEAGTRLAGLDPAGLVAAYGTPFFLYDLDVVSRRIAALRASIPDRVDLAFAVKANPSLAVVSHVARLGLGADVASGGELAAAIRAGIPLGRIVFTGPGKTDAELGRALRLGIRALTVESLDELDVLIELAPQAHLGQGLLLRLAVERSSESIPIIGGAGGGKFGLLPAEVDEAIDRLHRTGAAERYGGSYRVLGLHAFGATNVLDASTLVDGVRRLAVVAEAVAARHGLDHRLLDGGGGLGIPYADDEAPLDLAALCDGLAAELATWRQRPGLANARLLLEPGRFPLGPAGAYVVRVIRTKRRDGRQVAIVDGGVHQLARPALIGTSQRVVAVGTSAARLPVEDVTDVVGPLCTGLDVLATGVRLPALRAGDLLAVLDAGAYGFTESMPYFLSHPQPAEVVALRGRAGAARLRRDPTESISAQVLPFG